MYTWLYMQPITAYKFVIWGGKYFHSPMLHTYRWLPGWNVIDNGPLDTSDGGRNGFYSFKSEPIEVDIYYCVVELEIAGTIVECQLGYRSEFARINRVISWSPRHGDYSSYRRIDYIYEQDHSAERCRSVWPNMTPFTRVYELPSNQPNVPELDAVLSILAIN